MNNLYQLFDQYPAIPIGIVILGRQGYGKTSSLEIPAIVDNPESGGLLITAKPEDEGEGE
jgi:hypothetical protein